MNEKILIDIEGLKKDLSVLQQFSKSFQASSGVLRRGITHMRNGLDSSSLSKYNKDIKKVEKEISRLENLLAWAIVITQECIDTYSDVDAVLAKHTEEMLDENENVVSPTINNN